MPISNAEASRRYRERNLERRREEDRLFQARRRAEHKAIKDAARDRPCEDCGVQLPPALMDFDHRDGEKSFPVSQTAGRGYATVDQLHQEISKCVVRCPNCHRTRHWGHLPRASKPPEHVRTRRKAPPGETPEQKKAIHRDQVRAVQKRKRAMHQWIKHEALDRPCVDCYTQLVPQVMDFDHVRGTKEFNLGQSYSGNKYVSLEALHAEIAKCDVRCPNCHRLRHYNEEHNLEHPDSGQLAYLRHA